MDAQVYTEVRGCRFFSPERMLMHALISYSKDFSFHPSKNNVPEYHLFTPGNSPSLIVARYFIKTNPIFVPNVIFTFSSSTADESKKIAEDFERKSDLELLTTHEYKELGKFITSEIESSFLQNYKSSVLSS